MNIDRREFLRGADAHHWRATWVMIVVTFLIWMWAGCAHAAGGHRVERFVHNHKLAITGYAVSPAAGGATFILTHMTGGTSYGIASFICMAAWPIAATITEQRELTPREAYMGLASCVIPFGGLAVDKMLPHTQMVRSWYRPKS